MRHTSAGLLGLCILVVSPTAAAQALKCTDAQGNVTYTDLPCLPTEKTAIVDTRAASNEVDHSFIRSQKSRLATPPPAPPPVPVSYLGSPTPPRSTVAPSTLVSGATYTP